MGVIIVTFGKRLQQLREEHHLLQKDLGAELGITARAVSYYEADERFPKDSRSLVTIADYFKVSLDWLFGRTEHRSFRNDCPNELVINIASLPDEASEKIQEYAEMIKQSVKTKNI